MQRSPSDWVPLSEHQAALLRSAEAGDCHPARNAVAHLACYLPLDAARLERAIGDTIAAHPLLRASFDLQPGAIPKQVIHPSIAMQVRFVDLRSRAHALRPAVQALTGEPFSIGQAPLVRIAAHQMRDEEFRLTIVSHPAALDRWSQRALMAQVLTRYRGASAEPGHSGVAAVFPQPGGRSAVTGAGELADWAKSFADFTAALPMFWITPADGEEHPARRSHSPAAPLSTDVELPDGFAERLADLAVQLDVPVADIVLAAHAKAVAVATARTEVVVGVETNPAGEQPTRPIGMLASMLAARIPVRAGTWSSLIQETRRSVSSAAAFAHLSCRRVQSLLNIGRLLDSSFAYCEQALEADLLDGGAGQLGPLAAHPDGDHGSHGYARTPFDGTVLAEFFRGTATGRVRFRLTAGAGLSQGQLSEVARLHAEVLERCLAPGRQHRSLSPLTSRQRHLTLTEWNGATRGYDLDRPVHELVEDQVRRTPDAIAVTDSAGSLTYAALNSRANRIARRLQARGIGTGAVVGVCTRRDSTMLAAFLAAIKSGAAYLPLDPKQPAERVTYMLTDAQAAVVLADSTYAQALPAGTWDVLRADDQDENARFPDSDLGRTSTSSDLMYVMYTSGSTGLPKGVEVPHRGVANHLWFGVEAFAGNGTGGAPVISSTAFDMGVPNQYVPLLMGQRVCILDEDLDLFAVARRLNELAPFAFIKLTPGQLDTLSELLTPAEAQRLAGRLVVGADAFTVRTLKHWRRLDTRTPIVNDYGPTEASVGNSTYYVNGNEQGDLLPIGRPNPNTTMYVLDPDGSPAPVGVPGDLYIGGVCLARGYAGKPGLTRERFVPDPFSDRTGAKMYRTGDIGRWLPSGVLEFLGRADTQVKIRGYRVELAEVEAAMTRHPAISDAAVRAVGATRETLALAGYYVCASDANPDDVRAFLTGILPEYLVPSFLVPVSAIPLTRNGKVDRSALPAPARRRAVRARQQEAAAGNAGQAASRAWHDVFGDSPPGLGDPVAVPGGDPAAETQFALHLAGLAGISTERSFRLIAGAGTFGDLCEHLDQAVTMPGGDLPGPEGGSPQAAAAGPQRTSP